MSRVLASALGVSYPALKLRLGRLERAAGMPGRDIRLGLALQASAKEKIAELGLDPSITTGEELYRALSEKLLADEQKVRKHLGCDINSTPADILKAVDAFMEKEAEKQKIFAIKSVSLKAILKKCKPKATMKALGYRSMDSMFKHEPAVQLLVATLLVESPEWHKNRLKAYEGLQAKDFEIRSVRFEVPTGKKWPILAEKYIQKNRHNVIVVPEAGGAVFLPLTHDFSALAILTTLMARQAFETIRARGALLKLRQVQPELGKVVASAVRREPTTGFTLEGERLSWADTHRFYGSEFAPYHPTLFEPHLQDEDFKPLNMMKSLRKLNRALSFWANTDHLLFQDGSDIVSLNMLDVALAVCNHSPYSRRFAYYGREELARRINASYLQHDNFHDALQQTVSDKLVPNDEFIV